MVRFLLCAMMPLVSAITVPAPQKVVLKFGGSSLRDAERITEVCSLVVSLMEDDGIRPCLVCSAMGKTTDQLLGLARDVDPEPPRRELDMLVSTGERVSMALIRRWIKVALS
jgi:aspartate kinase